MEEVGWGGFAEEEVVDGLHCCGDCFRGSWNRGRKSLVMGVWLKVPEGGGEIWEVHAVFYGERRVL